MPNPNYNPDEFLIAIGDKQAIQRDKERRALAEELKRFAKNQEIEMPCKLLTIQDMRDDIRDARIAHLERQLAAAGTLPKIAIDYSKADRGNVPFDGERVLIHFRDGCIMHAHWDVDNSEWKDFDGYGMFHEPTHYTPMPEFYEAEGGEA